MTRVSNMKRPVPGRNRSRSFVRTHAGEKRLKIASRLRSDGCVIEEYGTKLGGGGRVAKKYVSLVERNVTLIVVSVYWYGTKLDGMEGWRRSMLPLSSPE